MILVKYLRHPPSDLGYQGSICSWDIGLQFGNILIKVWASSAFPGPSEDPVADVSRHILNSKSRISNKIRVSETFWSLAIEWKLGGFVIVAKRKQDSKIITYFALVSAKVFS